MSQICEMNDGRKLIELFGQKQNESNEQLRERMVEKAQIKLRNPEVNKFYQIKIGRDEPCPCGSGLKFKKCCWGKINQGEFEITPINRVREEIKKEKAGK